MPSPAFRRLFWLLNPSESRAAFAAAVLAGSGVLAVGLCGGWTWLERPLYDLQCQWFHAFDPPPGELVVHIDIDDQALATDRWPWHREKIAGVVRELDRAGASVIGLDLLLDDPQAPRLQAVPTAKPDAGGVIAAQSVHDDRLLADAMGASGRVLLAARPPEVWSEELFRCVPPVAPLAKAAAAVAGVPGSPDGDGVTRAGLLRLPGAAPTFALRAVCLHWGLAPEKITLDGDELVIPKPGGALRVPLVDARMGEGWRYPGRYALLRWPAAGRRHWQPDGNDLAIGRILDLARLDQQAQANELGADRLLFELARAPQLTRPVPLDLLQRMDGLIAWLEADPANAADADTRAARPALRADLRLALAAGGLPAAGPPPPALAALTGARDRANAALAQAARDRAQAAGLRAELKARCQNRICLVGWVATGAVADFVTTPQHSHFPGVMVHGTQIQNLLDGQFTRRAPWWLDGGLALAAAGLLGLAAWRLPPVKSVLAVAFGLGGLFAAIGFLAFDAGHLWVSQAWPLTCGSAGWLTVTVVRARQEQKRRRRITAQFRNYVSPALVDHLLAHPEVVAMRADERELTCVFTDFAGFTAISQGLDPARTAKLLNRYLAAATRAFMDSGGNVNKFMGDGILVFWGAPVADPGHALSACRGLLACHRALARLAGDPELAGLPALTLRAGAVTDRMMVGDFGAPPERSDYTVIGDGANLASRLESANKQLGTTLLVGEQTALRANAHMLLRPIARLRVVGRNTPEPVFELLAEKDRATAAQQAAAARSWAVLDAFCAGRFADCLTLLDAAEAHEPGAGWIGLHRAACLRLQSEPDPDFDGSVRLTGK